MPRDTNPLVPGDWVQENKAPHRRMQVIAIHTKPGHPAPNVEMAVAGNPVDRLSLSIHVLTDPDRFKRLR